MVTLHLDDSVIKSLSNNELNILKFVYENIEEVLNMSIQALSSRTTYSSATILRFCRKLGYSGFAEFKYALRAEAKKKNAGSEISKIPAFGAQYMADRLFSNIEGTASLISEDQLLAAFRYFDSGCPIYLWAPGGITSILTDYFEKLLFSIGRQSVYKIESAKMSEHILRNISGEALLILISTTGDFGPTLRLGKLARMNNVPVLSITPYTNNAVARLGTVSFRFFTDQQENRGAEFTPRLPVFYLISMIIRSYLYCKQAFGNQEPALLTTKTEPAFPEAVIPLFEKARQMKLTETEEEILKYFEEAPPSSAFTNLEDLSAALYTSNATIVRFCQKLGLKGYNEFKYQLRKELKQLRRQNFHREDFTSHSLALFKDNLEDIPKETLEEITGLLTGGRPVYIYGSNLSSLAAKYLQTILNTLDYPCILVEWQHLLNGLVHELNSDAVLFIITAHGDARRYLSVFQKARGCGADTILLTCEKDSPLIPYSTISLCTNDQNEEYHHVDINPRLGILTVIQLLVDLAAQKRQNAPAGKETQNVP